MKLMIIEDSLQHQAAARVQFPEAVVVNYDEAYELLREARPGDYSAILTDLHFKVERNRLIPSAPFAPQQPGNLAAIGTQLPFGLAFVLRGIELNTPVALVSDVDHHSDLVTGLLDMMGHVVRPRPGREESRHFVKNPGGSGPKAFTWQNRVVNPKFVLLRDMCPKAEDMYWQDGKIVEERQPELQSGEDIPAYFRKKVKDWREALRTLTAVAES